MFGFKNIKSLRDSYLIFLYLVWVCCIGNCKVSNCFSLQKLKKAIATMKWNKLSLSIIVRYFIINITVWKVSKYRVISGTYFPVFWLNTERYGVSLRIQSKYMKTWTRNNSVFGHFSRCLIHYSLTCLVMHKCDWKGNCFERRVKTLKCGDTRLMRVSWHYCGWRDCSL